MQENIIVQFFIFLGGIVGTVIGFMFDVPGGTIWAAAFGSVIGIAVRLPSSMLKGALVLLAGTFSIALLLPLLMPHLAEGTPQKSIAFIIAAVVIGGRNLLPEISEDVMREFGASAKAIIKAITDRIVNKISTKESGEPKL
jgi:hypothetical protein